MIDPLERLGRDVAAELGDGPSEERRRTLREKIGAMPLHRPTGRRWLTRGAWVGGGLALAAAAALAVLSIRGDSPTGAGPNIYQAEQLADGSWLSSAAADELHFTDGSRISLAARTRMRLSRANEDQVVISLEDGRVDADIRRAGRHWTIEAGPFDVEVLGTAFQVVWNPRTERAEVNVTRGLVRVSGGTLGTRGVELSRGDHLELDAAERRALWRAERRAERSGEQSGEESTATPTPARKNRRSVPPRRARPRQAEPAADSPPTWEQLAADRDYRAALNAAEREGFDRLCRRLGPESLDALASVARYARNAARARQALDALRTRFPQRPEGKMAVFLLGRVAAEIAREPSAAARWFREYVARFPQGTMASEAQGRLIQAYSQSGDGRSAITAARAYLTSYPEGPYAAAARAVAEGGSIE